jgi:hypothetical protein
MLELVAYLVAVAVVGYVVYAITAWCEYGFRHGEENQDPMLDRLLPNWEVSERHQIRINAPDSVAFAAARTLDLNESPGIRAIFRLRQLIMRSGQREYYGPRSVIERAHALGWGVLADIPGRRVVLSSVTQPWQPNIAFRALSGVDFTGFSEPGYAKVIWSIAVHPQGPNRAIVSTETRVRTTDAESRRRFRLYWALMSPGILIIRYLGLRLIRRQAEEWMRVPLEDSGQQHPAVGGGGT